MNDRLFGSAGFARADARALVTTVVVTVYDRGPSAAPDERYEAELAGYAAVREAAASPWEAVRPWLATGRCWSVAGPGGPRRETPATDVSGLLPRWPVLSGGRGSVGFVSIVRAVGRCAGGPPGLGGAVSRPRSESARVPGIRTAGGLVKRLGRALLWLLVWCCCCAGWRACSSRTSRHRRCRRRGPRRTWPDDDARAFAADFARAYLSYTPRHGGCVGAGGAGVRGARARCRDCSAVRRATRRGRRSPR